MSDKIDKGSASSTPETGASNENKEHYKIGYKRAPTKTQFKKGQSGNPSGSKKKAEEIDDIRIVMEDVLTELVKVNQDGKPRIVSREEAIMNAELVNALNGDTKAIGALFKRGQQCGLFTREKSKRGIILTERTGDDGKILRMFGREQEALRGAVADIDAGTTRSDKRR